MNGAYDVFNADLRLHKVAIGAKLFAALEGIQDQPLKTQAEIETYIDQLGFAIAGTYGGHSSCVQIETGGDEHVILDMGSGARPLGQQMIERFGVTLTSSVGQDG